MRKQLHTVPCGLTQPMASMDCDWGDALRGYLDTGDKLFQDIQDAQNAKLSTEPSPSFAGSQSDSMQAHASQHQFVPSTWWARMLHLILERLDMAPVDSAVPPISVVSACAGCSSESFALKAPLLILLCAG